MFCDMLKYLRMRDGMSQSQLAFALGIGRSTLAMYETGRREPPFEMLENIADFFNVNMDTLMGRDVPANKKAAPEKQVQPLVLSDAQAELVRMMERLSDEDQQMLLRLARAAFPSKD